MRAPMHDLAFDRPEPGKWQSAALAAGMHLLLGLFLFYSVRWQTSKPAAVQVELVSRQPVMEAPARPAPPPEPVIEKPPAPVVEPPPPPPQPKPDIALKEPPKPKPLPKVEPKPAPKPEPKPVEKKPEPKVEKKPDPKPAPPDTRREQESADKLLKDALARESAESTVRQAAQEADLRAKVAAEGARLKATQSWADRISAKVKGNITLPPGVSGKPEALVSIALLPDGSVVGEPKMKRSTGNSALDAAILRAIVKSSPLPKPDDASVFERNLDLKFRPLDE